MQATLCLDYMHLTQWDSIQGPILSKIGNHFKDHHIHFVICKIHLNVGQFYYDQQVKEKIRDIIFSFFNKIKRKIRLKKNLKRSIGFISFLDFIKKSHISPFSFKNYIHLVLILKRYMCKWPLVPLQKKCYLLKGILILVHKKKN